VGVVPGEVLDNPYSANVVDICPVGALTEADSRFKARVWYLSSAKSVCNGCSQGCNVDLHYVLDRPHLNGGARIVRVKPRYNPDENQWWMCDEGRFGFGWVDRGRLTTPFARAAEGVASDRGNGDGTGADAAGAEALAALAIAHGTPDGARGDGKAPASPRVGVLGSAQLTNEELFLLRRVFGEALGARVTASVPQLPGSSDDFLKRADRNPNTAGAELHGLAGPSAPDAGGIVDAALTGELDVLWVFGHDLVASFGEEKARALARSLKLLVFCGTNGNATVALAHWVLPGAAYVEKDGTFVNCQGRVQRIGRAFPPRAGAREEWRILLELARLLGQRLEWQGPREIFAALAVQETPFAGLDYDSIGELGVAIRRREPAAAGRGAGP
jgi:NADH-quinone oxidoreductase subunit G